MECFQSIRAMKEWSASQRNQGRKIGFVPTMGCLHEGHLSLVRSSLATCDCTVVSIFVNPAQFGENEDFETYPVAWEKDSRVLESLRVDAVFKPEQKEMYPPGYNTFICVEGVTNTLCGKSRPGFFKGVATVVLKLFQIVQPHIAFFGEKDRQQLGVIQKMATDLNLDIEIMGLPIVREFDGLAMSSRNLYLSEEERKSALSLNRALEKARFLVQSGETSTRTLKEVIHSIIQSEPHTQIDYISICDIDTFQDEEKINGKALIAIAVHVGKARLIDNCIVETK